MLSRIGSTHRLVVILALSCGCGPPQPSATQLPVASTTSTATVAAIAVSSSSPLSTKRFPQPPQQHATWKPPSTSLDSAVVSAIGKLFEHGMADPRGCEYRQIEIQTGSVWSGTGPKVETHGWVIAGATEPRYAIAFNGLIYELLGSAGPAANLAADIDALLTTAGKDDGRPAFASAEAATASHDSILLSKVAMLLRLGHAKRAQRVWETLMNSGGRYRPAKEVDPYLMLASDWLWSAFDSGLTAHMRGDDALALHRLLPLDAASKAIGAEAKRRGHKDDAIERGIGFLGPLQALLKDQRRRSRRAAVQVGKARLQDIAAMPLAERVKALVQLLDEVAARQWGQPGGVNLASDPIVGALISIGEPAIEALLDVFETDERLTRSVHFWRDFSRHRTLLGVHEAAYAALATIMEQSFFEIASTGDSLSARGKEGRKRVAAKLRGYWAKWRATPLHERWFKMLADDAAKPALWVDAARKIAQPANQKVQRSSMIGTTTVLSAAGSSALRGERLRAKKRPSVADLMALRIKALSANVQSSCAIAKALGRWDTSASSMAVLSTQLDRAIAASVSKSRLEHRRCIAELTLMLADKGPKPILKKYADWITTTRPSQDNWGIGKAFEPLWRYGNQPLIKRAAAKLFGKGSAWMPLIPDRKPAQNEHYYPRVGLLKTPLIGVAAFRKHVLDALADQVAVGSLEMSRPPGFSVKMIGGWTTGSSAPEDDAKAPKTAIKRTVRRCDFYAWQLADHLDGAPKYKPYWTRTQRDAAIATLKTFVVKLKP